MNTNKYNKCVHSKLTVLLLCRFSIYSANRWEGNADFAEEKLSGRALPRVWEGLGPSLQCQKIKEKRSLALQDVSDMKGKWGLWEGTVPKVGERQLCFYSWRGGMHVREMPSASTLWPKGTGRRLLPVERLMCGPHIRAVAQVCFIKKKPEVKLRKRNKWCKMLIMIRKLWAELCSANSVTQKIHAVYLIKQMSCIIIFLLPLESLIFKLF